MAFYILWAIGKVISSARRNKYKILVSIFLVIIVYNSFLMIPFENEQLSRLQYRLQVTDGVLNGDNREHESYTEEFNLFLSDGGRDLWLGKGEGAASLNKNMSSSYTYKSLIYEYGIIGFVFIIFWLLYTSYFSSNKELFHNPNYLAVLIVFLISMYQRPNVLVMGYFITLFGGFSYIWNNEKNEFK